MAQLAIKGDRARGSEIIALLKMLGGVNTGNCDGKHEGLWYFINEYTEIYFFTHAIRDKFVFYTLEEFFAKYPYKVGDKVKVSPNGASIIKLMRWSDEDNSVKYRVDGLGYWFDAETIQPYTEQKEESMEEKSNNLAKWDLPEGYEFQDGNGNVIDVTKIMLVKKQPQYPKTYEGCCNILKYSGNYYFSLASKIDDRLFEAFYKLKVCRDAYWKIAGDWKPDWNDYSKPKFIIVIAGEEIKLKKYYSEQKLLAFPTGEMRDAFCKNFKDLIEECKELL